MSHPIAGTMRAAQYRHYGGPEVLHVATVPRPEPGQGEVLVRVHASTVNGGEPLIRSGKVRMFLPRRFPKGTGIDFSGEVAALGSSIPGVEIGDRVWGAMKTYARSTGTTAQYVIARPEQIAPKPPSLGYVDAAALAGVGVVALIALREKAKPRAGETLLVRGGSGGVGTAIIQLARAMGAHVTTLVRAENIDAALSTGAHAALDYRTTDPEHLDRFDVIIDTVGTDLRRFRQLVAPGGRMVTIMIGSVSSAAFIVASSVFGSRRVRFFSGTPRQHHLVEVARLVEAGDVRPTVDTIFDLDRIADAHRVLQAGGVHGKVVIRIPQPPPTE